MGNQGLQQLQRQAQTLVLAPQLRQSLKILQVPALELRNTILEELQQNPALEEMPSEGLSLDEPTRTDDQHDQEPGDFTPDGEMRLSDDDFSALGRMSEDYREYYAHEANGSPYTSEDAERRQHFFDSLVSETSLQEHLMRQAELLDLTPNQRQAIEFLLGSLDDRGFLTTSLSDLALQARLPLADVQRAAETLKTLEPHGIGCADVRECLLVQLRFRGLQKSLAARILREEFDRLLRRRLPEIARKLGVELDDVQEALEVIATLDPAPGRRFGEDLNRVIEPDVTIERDGDGWNIHLNTDYIPRLRISSRIKQMMTDGVVRGKDREYLREQIRSGKFLIGSIEQRQQTIRRITEEILAVQQPFFEHGVSALKPLTMNQIALKVGVHETTVSRAIANKFVATPHGIFEFKYFFTPGYQGINGEAVSNTSVKDRIGHLISTETPQKPYSDQDIVGILADEDVTIARRTVAKYREELGIPPTSLRRQYR